MNDSKPPQLNRNSLELLYHISREIASTLDLPAVLQRVLLLSMRNIQAHSGSVIVLDGSGHPVDSAIIFDSHLIDHTTDQLKITLEEGLAGWVVRRRQAVLIPDTSRDNRWLQRPDDAEDATGSKSAVSVPLIARDQITGVITLVHSEPNSLTLDHLELIQAIADQAAIAVLNARLYAESRRQARVMSALAESAAAITASLNQDEVLNQILGQISQALEVSAVSLALIDPSHQHIEYQASTSRASYNIVGTRLELGQGIAGWVAQEGQGTIVYDVYQDPRFYPEIDQRTGFKTQAIACAPIRAGGEVIGVLEAINPKHGSFDPDALLVLTGIGSLAGSAIQHAQLFTELETAHKRYRDLFDDNLNTMLVTDWKGHILEANNEAAVLSGYEKETLQHLTVEAIHDIKPGELGPKYAALKSGETHKYESTLHTQSGEEIPIEVRVHSVQAGSSSFIQWVFRSILERKELDQLRDDLLSSIYHDLRSPLSNVVSSMDVLANMLNLEECNPAIKSLFNIAWRSTERIQRLTTSLLDMNRLEAGQPIVNLTFVPPKDLIQDSVETVAPIAKNKTQTLRSVTADDLPPVWVDGEMIRRVLINLLENAVKFTPPESEISVGADLNDGWVRMWVEDSGPGIPQDERVTIFDKYTRLQRTHGPSGFGLGLAYCRLAVEGHGGKIWIESTPKTGARFIFTLPINER